MIKGLNKQEVKSWIFKINTIKKPIQKKKNVGIARNNKTEVLLKSSTAVLVIFPIVMANYLTKATW